MTVPIIAFQTAPLPDVPQSTINKASRRGQVTDLMAQRATKTNSDAIQVVPNLETT